MNAIVGRGGQRIPVDEFPVASFERLMQRLDILNREAKCFAEETALLGALKSYEFEIESPCDYYGAKNDCGRKAAALAVHECCGASYDVCALHAIFLRRVVGLSMCAHCHEVLSEIRLGMFAGVA